MGTVNFMYNWTNCKADIYEWDWIFYTVRFFKKWAYIWAKPFDKLQDATQYLTDWIHKDNIDQYIFINNEYEIFKWTTIDNNIISYTYHINYRIDWHLITDTTSGWSYNSVEDRDNAVISL